MFAITFINLVKMPASPQSSRQQELSLFSIKAFCIERPMERDEIADFARLSSGCYSEIELP
jgi:hypothetical protein